MLEAIGTGWAPGLRKTAAGDPEAVARLEGELFGTEAWSRDLLVAELVASHRPMADRRYVVTESEESNGNGDAYDAADCAVGTGSYGSRFLGYAGFYHTDGLTSVDLLTITITSAARGRGIVPLMLTELVSIIREVSCPDVLLEVRQSNEAAQRLYTRHGFVPIGRRRRYYRAPPEDAVVMWPTPRPRPEPVGAEAGDPSGV